MKFLSGAYTPDQGKILINSEIVEITPPRFKKPGYRDGLPGFYAG
jgi:ABC-type sugar transport system ATPase subunit